MIDSETFLDRHLLKTVNTKRNMTIDKELLHQAIKTWGIEAQCDMIIEECIELALAVQKLKRKRGDREAKITAVIDEIADVRIIIEQAMIIFADPENRIQERIDFKMNRLKERLAEKAM